MNNYMISHKYINFAEVEWNLIKIKENNIFHDVSLIFKNQTSYLWIIFGNMDFIPKLKQKNFPQFWYGLSISANC